MTQQEYEKACARVDELVAKSVESWTKEEVDEYGDLAWAIACYEINQGV